jgi:N-acyl-D-amino-acid deacylase
MRRRTFVHALAIGTVGGWRYPYPQRRADLLIAGGIVYDGTGAAPMAADVLVRGDRIARVAAGIREPGVTVIDARGRAVAPGFIDIHSHTDSVLLAHPRAESKIRQGVTTEVAGQDGSSVAPASPERAAEARERYARDGLDVDLSSLDGFFRALEANPAAVNFASMVGAGTVRGLAIGDDDRPPSAAELARMVALVEQAVRDGACGLSSGLEYVPGGFADTAELAALARPFRARALPYSSHMRNEDDELLAAIEEALQVGRTAGVPVQIAHLKAQGRRNWWKAGPVLELLAAARADGIDVRYDRYPYVAYATGLSNLFPLWARDGGSEPFMERLRDPALRTRIEQAVLEKIEELGEWDAVQITSTGNEALAWTRGRRLGALARERDQDPFELLLRIMIDDGGRTGMVGFGMSEDNTERYLAHPLGMICSDGSALATEGPLARGTPHPRNFGTFPRVLGHYCRERRAMALETAIHKMTGMPADRLHLPGRGRLAAGAFADLVVFDPDTVADRATFEAPRQYPTGIEWVIVNGEPVIREGEHTGARPGRVLRSSG